MDYQALADSLASDIASGRLKPGDRLPPQRRFARQRGIASSTAARVYGELVRRGLAVGEVGRGTYIRASSPVEHALAEPGGAPVDLQLNFSVLPGQAELMAGSLGGVMRASVLRPSVVGGPSGAVAAAGSLLARDGWVPGSVLFAGNGRQAIAAAMAALVPAGGRLGVEAITYPVVKSLAARLGITLVPLAVDSAGLVVSSLDTARVQAVYIQPVLHNPLGCNMSAARRVDLAAALADLDIYAIEDSIYSFLAPVAPVAPSRSIVVDSLSKRLAAGLSVGFLSAPPELVDRVASAVRSGGWGAQSFAVAAMEAWVGDGVVARVEEEKRADALARQALARARIPGLLGDSRAYHCWWELPGAWRAETFVAAAARRGIALSPAAAFAVVPGHAPNAVRLSLAAPARDVLASALDTLAGIAGGAPEDVGLE
ncbi:PLP-dependent aminotransferase family protein [Actinocrispum sp. NPDC049592]|uniref:aminotransferase-like domain-containing protein n=1 Tax=Actinocrispum sp. NPDC049592 TaxID=3154835 RepID=UPI00341D5C66